MKYLIVLLCITAEIHTSFAQSKKLQAMEDELVFIQNTAAKMWINMLNSNYDNDELNAYDNMVKLLCRQFDNMLNQMLVEDKDMAYPFTKLQIQKNKLLSTNITWSEDSLLRVFSWSLPSGTMHFYGNSVQYKVPNSIVRSFSFENSYNRDYEVDKIGYHYDTIYTLNNKNKIIYILSGATLAQTMYPTYQLTAYSIENEFISADIFEDENGNIVNEISVAYDIGCSNIEGNNFPRPTINKEKRIMNLLEINENCFTGKFIKCKFDGKKFIFNSN